MGQQHLLRLCTAVVATIGISTSLHAAAGQITPLMIGESSRAYDINDSGTVVGWMGPAGANVQDPRLWSDVSPPPAGNGFWYAPSATTPDILLMGRVVYAINNAGTAAGAHVDSTGVSKAFVSDGNDMYVLDTGTAPSRAFGITESGVILGSTGSSGSLSHAFRHTGGGSVSGSDYAHQWAGSPYAANAAGVVVGAAMTGGSGRPHAFTLTDWESPRLLYTGGHDSAAFDINDNGVAVGFISLSFLVPQAFRTRWDDIEFLPSLGGTQSVAYAVNSAGLVLGWATTESGDQHAVAWSNDAYYALDLNDFLAATNPTAAQFWTLTEARAINSSGMIVGTGNYNDGPGGLPDGQFAYILDASSLVPEPTILLTLAASTPLLLLRQRRRTTCHPSSPWPRL